MLSRHCKSTIKAILLVCMSGCLPEIASLDCYSCRGINCQRTTKINETTTCASQWDDCVTIFAGSSVAERGCYSAMPEEYRRKCAEPTSAECHKCFGNLCNNQGTASCIQCNSNENRKCFNDAKSLGHSRCPVPVGSHTYCFERSNPTVGFIERGCLTDLRQQVKCLDDSECQMCLPSPGVMCNQQITSIRGGGTQVTIYGLPILILSSVLRLLN